MNHCSLMSIKKKRVKFANWIRTNFRKGNAIKILFSNEKMFDIDGIYNSQNDRIWAVNRTATNTKGGLNQKQMFPQNVMVWFGVCSKGVFPLMIFKDGTMDHGRYIKEVLPVALKFGNELIGLSSKTVQSHTFMQNHRNGVLNTCLVSLTRITGPRNSPDLNPFVYSI